MSRKKFLYKATGLFLATVIGLSVSGCASRAEVLQFKTDMRDIRLVLSALQSENKDIETKLNKLQASMQNFEQSSNRNKADILAEMSSLRERNQYLMGMLNDTGDLMSKLVHKIKERATSQSDLIDSLLVVEGHKKAGPEKDLDAMELYDSAYLDLSEQNYEMAESGFLKYLKVFPESDYADNASYWLGEISYARKEYEKAFEKFKQVTIDYPAGDKMPDALLKMAYCLINLGQKSKAKKILKRIIGDYPGSSVASLAEARLNRL